MGAAALMGTLVLEEGSMPLAVPSQGQGRRPRGPRSGVGLSIQSWGPSRSGDREREDSTCADQSGRQKGAGQVCPDSACSLIRKGGVTSLVWECEVKRCTLTLYKKTKLKMVERLKQDMTPSNS